MQQWRQIQILGQEGLTNSAIARRLGLDRQTVTKWLGQPAPGPILRSGRANKLDEYEEHVRRRLEAFPDLTAKVLFQEIRGQGDEGGYERVKILCRRLRGPVLRLARENPRWATCASAASGSRSGTRSPPPYGRLRGERRSRGGDSCVLTPGRSRLRDTVETCSSSASTPSSFSSWPAPARDV